MLRHLLSGRPVRQWPQRSFGASPLYSTAKASFRAAPLTRRSHQPFTGTVQAFMTGVTHTPSADFCRPAGMNRFTLSPVSGTNDRPPEVNSTAFRTQPPDLQPVPWMDMDFVVNCQLVRPRMPLIRFLYIGSYVRAPRFFQTPPHDDAPSGGQGDFHPQLSNMPGTQQKAPGLCRGLSLMSQGSAYRLTWRLAPPPGPLAGPLPRMSPVETSLTQSEPLPL